MEHAEMTKHIRARITKSGIKARVWTQVICGEKWITVKPETFDSEFTPEECKTIKTIAKVNGLTHTQNLEIELDVYIAGAMTFVYHN